MSDEPLPNRRAFLNGRSAVDAIRERADSSVTDSDRDVGIRRPPSRCSNYLEQYSTHAMACEFEISFNMHQYPQAGSGAMDAFELIAQLEAQMSVYREDSEISKINQGGTGGPIIVEEHLYRLLKLSIEIYESTNFAFDMTAGQLSKVWGFESRNGKLPHRQSIAESLDRVGSNYLTLSDGDRSIRISKDGVLINLGGIGKGAALDRAGNLLSSREIGDFIIHGGKSSVLAFGESVHSLTDSNDTGSTRSCGWKVGVSHPTLPDTRLAEVVLRNQALGTSGSGRQGFFHQGKRYGHIIDPRTGWPASHFLSTTVISPSAALSDALATAFFVMTLEEVDAFCESHSHVSAIIVSKNRRLPGQVELHPFNLSDDDWKRL